MEDLLMPVAFIALGVLLTLPFSVVWYRHRTASVIAESERAINRARDVERLMSRQAEDLSTQLLNKTKEHAAELDRLALDRRNQEEQQVTASKIEVRQAREEGYEEGKRQAELRADEKVKAFSVSVRPYVKSVKNDNFLFKNYKLLIGYQYQLQVNGIPCFEPHVVIERHLEEKEVNQQVIERITELALEVARSAVSIQAGPAGAFIPINPMPVIES